MRNAGLARAGHQRLAKRLDGFAFVGVEQPERHTLRPRLTRREQNLGAAHARGEQTLGAARAEGERAEPGAFHKGASFYLIHAVLPIGDPKRFAGRCVRLVLNYSKVIVTLLFIPVNATRARFREISSRYCSSS